LPTSPLFPYTTLFRSLVFFMVATLSMTIQRGLPVNLPSSASAKADIPDTVSITVTAAGAVFVNKEAVSVHELRDRLRGVQQAQTDRKSTRLNSSHVKI